MAEEKAKGRRKRTTDGPTPLAVNLKRLMSERRLSARGLSKAADLTADTVRAICSVPPRSHSPTAETVQALARYLGVTVDQLTGREELPPTPAPGAAPAPSLQGVRIDEVDFVPRRGSLPHPAADLERSERQIWLVPSEVLAERGISLDGLLVVRAPEDHGDVRRGDRLLIDTADTVASPPGLFLAWDTVGVVLGRCSTVRRGGVVLVRFEWGPGHVDELRLGEDLELLGRVVGRWAWT